MRVRGAHRNDSLLAAQRHAQHNGRYAHAERGGEQQRAAPGEVHQNNAHGGDHHLQHRDAERSGSCGAHARALEDAGAVENDCVYSCELLECHERQRHL